MIKTILPIFTIYELSLGNRLLLQTVPQQPPQQPPITIPPPPIHPQVPQVPFITPPVGPVLPVPPTAAYPWANPGGPAPAARTNKLQCILTPPALGSCAGTIQTALNPDINWELLCSGLGSCYGATIHIDFTPTAMPIEELKGFWFTNDYAASGATIIINNPTGRQIRIAEVKCDKPYSCQGATFITGSDAFIEQGDFFCNAVGSCDGCYVKTNAMDPGLPCTSYVEPI